MIGEAEFTFLAREVKTRTGAVISRDASAIVETKLIPLVRRESLSSVTELIQQAKIRPEKLWGAIADALAQTETRFFRDRDTFQRLKTEIIPEIARRRKGAYLNIWCAGAGTGQEAYSLAIMIDELRAEGLPGADIVATDMSERLLDKARSGLYTQFEVQRGLPIRKLIEHFEKAGDLWRISDRLRAAVRFEQHNLLQHPAAILSSAQRFDIILCCNVMPAFDVTTRIDTITRISDALAPDGVLVLGSTETLPEGIDGFSSSGSLHPRIATRRAA